MSIFAEITGKESPAGDGSALDALIDFYRSFNSSDLNALAANWADGEVRAWIIRLVVSGADGLPSKRAMRSCLTGQRQSAWCSTIRSAR